MLDSAKISQALEGADVTLSQDEENLTKLYQEQWKQFEIQQGETEPSSPPSTRALLPFHSNLERFLSLLTLERMAVVGMGLPFIFTLRFLSLRNLPWALLGLLVATWLVPALAQILKKISADPISKTLFWVVLAQIVMKVVVLGFIHPPISPLGPAAAVRLAFDTSWRAGLGVLGGLSGYALGLLIHHLVRFHYPWVTFAEYSRKTVLGAWTLVGISLGFIALTWWGDARAVKRLLYSDYRPALTAASQLRDRWDSELKVRNLGKVRSLGTTEQFFADIKVLQESQPTLVDLWEVRDYLRAVIIELSTTEPTDLKLLEEISLLDISMSQEIFTLQPTLGLNLDSLKIVLSNPATSEKTLQKIHQQLSKTQLTQRDYFSRLRFFVVEELKGGGLLRTSDLRMLADGVAPTYTTPRVAFGLLPDPLVLAETARVVDNLDKLGWESSVDPGLPLDLDAVERISKRLGNQPHLASEVLGPNLYLAVVEHRLGLPITVKDPRLVIRDQEVAYPSLNLRVSWGKGSSEPK